MKLFLGVEGKEKIKAAIVKMIDELELEAEDQIYFHVEKKSDFDALVKALDCTYFTTALSK